MKAGLCAWRCDRTSGMGFAVVALVIALCAQIAVAVAGETTPPAELILSNARIYTLNPEQPWAQAVAIGKGRILAVGSDATVLRWKGPNTRVMDLASHLVTPGLIDAHVHLMDGARYLKNVALRDAATMAEVGRRVAAFAHDHPRGDWILGEGWSYGYPDLPGGEFHKQLLDAISADRPVFLNSGMAHAAWVNSAALRRAGITRDTPNPAGGEIVRGPDGEATGWLKEESAVRLVQKSIPVPSSAEDKAALLLAIHEANRLGLTRLDSAGGDFAQLQTLAAIEREGKLTLRISIADWIDPPVLTADHLARLEAARRRYRGPYLSCCVAKFIMDGVLESHTAYLPGGYADQPTQVGMRFFAPQDYKSSVLELQRRGFQIYTHAIGDGAIKLALDAYGEAQAMAPGASGPRHRIEHAEAPDAEDIARFGRLGVIASLQPLMIYPRDEWKGMEGLWERYAGAAFLPRAFAIRSYLDSGAVVAFGTDWPIVQLNPLLGIRNAVLRQSLDGQPAGGYVPQQRISVTEALRAYTLDAAFASRADSQQGSIRAGRFADLVVFSQNILENAPQQIPAAHVQLTLVGGKIVYQAE